MRVITQTDRFILREFEPTDLDDMLELDSDPEVHRFLGNNPIVTKVQAAQTIENIIQQYKDFGIGRLAVISKKTNEFMGWSGLKFERIVINNTSDYFDLGYRIKKKFWGQGIATETAIELLRFGFEDLRLQEICAAAHIDNIGSNKVLQKIGMLFIEEFMFKDISCNWYKLTTNEYIKKITKF